jgi:hypothetical protein
MILKFSAGVLMEFLGLIYAYTRFNKPNPYGMVSLRLLILYVQMVQQLGQLPLAWPAPLIALFEVGNRYLSILGFLDVLSVHFECVSGSNFWLGLLADSMGPLTLAGHMGVFLLGGRLMRRLGCRFRPPDMNKVINTMGLVIKGVFITIASMPLRLFVTDTMPSGQVMVKAFPDLEVGSKPWMQAVPVAVFFFCAYCITFLAYVAYAVVKAPKWAGTWPEFSVRYRFAFGVLRPDRWWWCLVQMCYGFGFMIVQVVTPTVHSRIYVMTWLVEAYAFFCFYFGPYKFKQNNAVEVSLQACMLFFLIIATSFIDTDRLSPEELEATRNSFSIAAILVLGLGIVVAVQSWINWMVSVVLDKYSPLIHYHIATYSLAVEFRDVASKVCLLPDHGFINAVSRLSEMDQTRLQETTRTLVAIFLKFQPSAHLRHQRVMPGVPYQVWDRRVNAIEVLQASLEGKVQTAFYSRASARLSLMILADDLRNKGLLLGGHPSLYSSASNLAKIAKGKHKHASAKPLTLEFPEQATVEEFCETLKPHTCITNDELRAVYQVIDYSEDGKISGQEMTVALMAAAPPQTEEHDHQLRRIRNEMLAINEKPDTSCEVEEKMDEETEDEFVV